MLRIVSWFRQPKLLFPFIIIGAILISLILVAISLVLYNQSGAAQLDLSRPSYEAVRSQTHQTEPFTKFEPSNGVLKKEDYTLFEKLFTTLYSEKENDNMQTYKDAFSPDALSDEALGITVEQQ